MTGRNTLNRNEIFWGYLFIIPPLLHFLIFMLVPMVFSLWLSFQNWNMLSPIEPAGIKNFVNLFHDEKFWKSLYNTVYLMMSVPLGMVLSLTLALLMNRKLRGVLLLRALYYLPAICSVVASAQMWQWIFNSNNGLINTFLWNIFRIQGPNWLQDPVYAKIPMIVMSTWSSMGVGMLFFLAGLQNIPDIYYEAASIDGANHRQKFFFITLPKLTPTIFFIIVLGAIGGLQNMAQTYAMFGSGGGGPQYSAGTVMYYLWESAFNYYSMGYASAIAWANGILIFILTIINFRISSRWVNYD